MPPLPDLSVLARVRWGNVAIVVTVLAAGGLIVAWPSLRAQTPPLPPAAPRPVSAQRATTTRTTPPPQAWGSEFGVESAAPVAPTPTTPRAHPHPPKAHEPVHRHPAVKHKRHTARPTPQPTPTRVPTPTPLPPPRPPPVPPPPRIAHPPPPPSVSSEFPPTEF
jgi:hypothetical protein